MRYEKPFPHTVIDEFLPLSQVQEINRQWPDEWTKEDGSFQRKWSTQILPPAARWVVDHFDIDIVREATGIEGLFGDPDLFGAGLHCIPPGGFLNLHCDFNAHPKGWRRRANVLIYLNEIWSDTWGGHLSLGRKGEKRIAPIAGRCVIFETTEESWHGHPEPLKCPKDIQRRSLALYFYTDEDVGNAHSTVYIK